MSSVALPLPARFCPRCGRALVASGMPIVRPTCAEESCRYTWYPDPKVAVGVVAECKGRILLVRRNHEPRMGKWGFPSGFVDAGEVLEEAARRETLEETGVQIDVGRLLGAWSEPDNPVVFLAYAAVAVGGEPSPGDEAFEVGYFAPDALPPLAFDHDHEVLGAWRAQHA